MAPPRLQNKRKTSSTSTALFLLASIVAVSGFSLLQPTTIRIHQNTGTALCATRYGPPMEDMGRFEESNEQKKQEDLLHKLRTEFRQLLDKVLNASKVEHIPSLLTKHTEILLQMKEEFAVQTIQEILRETQESGGEQEVERVSDAIELILSFTEDFVDQSQQLDEHNKQLLGKIIRTMTQHKGLSGLEREEKLDELIAQERDHFTRGFLRHLDGECERIESAPQITKESMRLKEMLLVIKARIVEELGKDLGEAAVVLGQLVAHESKQERLAILDAGLTVRGFDFAVEMSDLTEEALQGFQSVPGGVDPTLVQRVEEIHNRVKIFLDKNSNFQ